KVPGFRVVVVFIIGEYTKNGETDDSHLTTLPVLPERVSAEGELPEQIAVSPEIVPPTDG
ncbi:MAG: hypothetical protein H3C56_08115, partial [Chitinophagaceae bacterium]|nr:hypothetical protein [Chitinophagaceae bacterium]